jgi:hypothetical protein
MVRFSESRFERRRKERLEEQANKMTPTLPEHLKSGRPKYGVPATQEQLSERERILKRFGEQANEREKERRQKDRRKMSMSPDEVEDWLKRNGISGGDRRQGQRRQGDRRR